MKHWKLKNLTGDLATGLMATLILAVPLLWVPSLLAQNPAAPAAKPTTLDEKNYIPTGDFGLDDVEELPLPTDEEGGVQVDGKDYIDPNKKPVVAQPVKPAPTPVPVMEPVVPAEPTQAATEAAQEPSAPVPSAPVTPSQEPAAAEAPASSEPSTVAQPVQDLPADGGGNALDSVPETAATTESAPAVAAIPARLGAAGAPDVYNIEKGDNLWDICQRFFGDPFLWPKLWAMNQYISNPHLIFPGDQLRFMMGTTTTPPQLEIGKMGEPQAPGVPELAKAETTLEAPAVTEKIEPGAEFKSEKLEAQPSASAYAGVVEVKNWAFVTPKIFDASGRITHSGEEKYMLSAGDNVYLKFDDPSSVHVGDMFHVMEVAKKVKHPKRGKMLGYMVHLKARVKVVKIEERTITGVIDDSWEVSSRDDRVVPYASLIRQVTPKESQKKIDGYIIESAAGTTMIGMRDIAFVNVGKSQGVESGDILRVVVQGDGVLGQKSNLPDVAIGQMTVVETLDDIAVVFVNWSRKSLEIGDRVTTRL